MEPTDVSQSASDSPSSSADRPEVTRLLEAWSEGSEAARERLFDLVYEDLKVVARNRLRHERDGHTLETTALLHEAYLRLVRTRATDWRDRAHFFAVASRVIRHVLVDHARSRNAEKRGGGRTRVTLEPGTAAVGEPALEVLALEEALQALGEHSTRMVRVVECRFFGGLSVKETAAALDVSPRTVEREWQRARVYLYRELGLDQEDGTRHD